MASPDPITACREKKRYSTEQRAKDAALKCWRVRSVDLRVYACNECGGFHLTHMAAEPMMRPGFRPPEPSREAKARARRRDRGRRKQWS